MKLSKLLAPTLRQDPAEAEILSHKLMLRSGMIRKLAAGIYNFLPLGLKALQNIAQIVREEMNRAGAQEVFMPSLLPSELWQETGRWDVYGKELFRIKDRHDREFCLGPTHEEVITDIVRKNIKSYKELPINLYQIQTKMRDEIRPRFGIMRSREFIMKDSYSFHATEQCAEKEYKNMHDTYCRIFDRLGLAYRVVEADPGAIGGGFSQEFMVLADTGEEEIFYCEKCNYAASKDGCAIGNVGSDFNRSEKQAAIKEVHTPNAKTIEEVVAFLKATPQQMIKTLIYKSGDDVIAALVRGDRAINEAKLKKALGVEMLELADTKTIENVSGAKVGFAGPVGLKGVKIVADQLIPEISNGITGANKTDYHITNVAYERDFKADIVADISYAQEGDQCPKCDAKFKVCRGIEVGHIFKLGKKYSKSMKAVFLDESNKEQEYIMGCYGIGVSRIVAASIEQNNDKDGIIWPMAIAPFKVAIVPVNMDEKDQADIANKIYSRLLDLGIETILDDRQERAGVKLKDIDLMGFPIKVIIGPKGLKDNKVELKMRKTQESTFVEIDKIVDKVKELVI